ncbi:KDEL motif-containing protein 1 [Harpegnathos saltator]|uniref:KDEL motif-containing protein 1 n=1 Tax=Harpegnathos saltator TaxID=610380 RepID=E2BK29_HARSA|nr:KDEL motif-containing protein 1 [Harpegnathos saltator]
MQLITLLVVLMCVRTKNVEIDPLKTIIWGPGLQPAEITMRARYIFLQLIDVHGKNLTESPGENTVTGLVQGQSFNDLPCRIWTQLFDCKDGSFILRYKVFNTCLNIKIKVKIKGKELPMEMLDTLSVQGNTDLPWENKVEQLFWRGRDSRKERLDLIDISRKHPKLFNVSITNFFFFKDKIDKYGPGQSHVSFFDFFKYKYQLNIDGTVATYRFPYLLAGDSLVFKQESKYYEFFYKDLTSGLHYVPVKSDLSDLVEKIQWAKEHDEDGLKIAKSARQFARDNLLPRDILCYYTTLFHEWSKRLKSKVKVLNNMEEVPQPSHSCQCHLSNLNLKDEL